MMGDLFQRTAQASQSADTIDPADVEKWKKSPDNIKMLVALATSQSAVNSGVSIQEITPVSSSRQDKKAAKDIERAQAGMSGELAKAGMAIQVILRMNAYVMYAVQQAQDDITQVVYGYKRHEGMNEFVAAVGSQNLQDTAAEVMAVKGQCFKRVMERL